MTSSLEEAPKTWGGSRYTPFAFTESGVAMLSSILNSEKAIQVNIAIMRAFVELRMQHTPLHSDLAIEVATLNQKFDQLINSFQDEQTPSAGIRHNGPVKQIQEVVARHFGLRVKDLISSDRRKSFSQARHIAIFLMRKRLSMSLLVGISANERIVALPELLNTLATFHPRAPHG